VLLLIIAAAAAAPNPATIDQPRKNFVACIKQFEAKSRSEKIVPDGYSDALKAACTAESQKLTNALIAYDVAMGTKRTTAANNAAMDVDDYWLTSEERYKDAYKPPQ